MKIVFTYTLTFAEQCKCTRIQKARSKRLESVDEPFCIQYNQNIMEK